MSSKLSKTEFVRQARKVHGFRYQYSNVIYVNSQTKIDVGCRKHGLFSVKPNNHIHRASGCPNCDNERKRGTKQQFLAASKQMHSSRYSYNRVKYVDHQTPVEILCKEHGTFWQKPADHMSGSNCPVCTGHKSLPTKLWIAKAVKIHGAEYDYSKVDTSRQYVRIKCHKHGYFNQRHVSHLVGDGCPKCGVAKAAKTNTLTTEEFISRARKIHGDRFCYAQVKYKNTLSKITIICKLHGAFTQGAKEHLLGHGCFTCHLMSKAGYKKKSVIRNGIEFQLQGYEPMALDWMLRQKQLKPESIKHGLEVPVVEYTFRNKRHKHFPDFYLPKLNKLVEVKSIWTLGLQTNDKGELYNRCRAKCIASMSEYSYTLLLMNQNGARLKLPNNWYELTRTDLLKLLRERGIL